MYRLSLGFLILATSLAIAPHKSTHASVQQSNGSTATPKKQAAKPKRKTPALSDNIRVTRDVEFAKVDSHSLLLDIYQPKNVTGDTPLVVWIHGGGWNKGSKDRCPITWLCDKGFSVASINYRLTTVAQWPAQIVDCRAAIAFLRRERQKYALAADRIGVCGASAGGHLVALLGTLNQNEADKSQSSVQAVCDFFGPTDLLTMPNNVLSKGKTEADLAKVNGAQLLGGIVRNMPLRAKHASAYHQISSGDVPTLIIHGDSDAMVPLEQSTRFHSKLKAAGCDSTLHIVKGAGHGMKAFQTSAVHELIAKFFITHIGSEAASRKP